MIPIYRAWSNKYNKMFRVSEISQTRDGYTHGLIDPETTDEYQPTQEEFEKHPYAWIGRVDFIRSPTTFQAGLFQNQDDEPFILMQYSGLLGKGGKAHIFEGDSLKYLKKEDESILGYVVLNRGAFYFRSEDEKNEDILLNEINYKCEIVGHIYERGLLEKQLG